MQANQDEVRKGFTFLANPSHPRKNLPVTSATLARPALRFLTVVYIFILEVGTPSPDYSSAAPGSFFDLWVGG